MSGVTCAGTETDATRGQPPACSSRCWPAARCWRRPTRCSRRSGSSASTRELRRARLGPVAGHDPHLRRLRPGVPRRPPPPLMRSTTTQTSPPPQPAQPPLALDVHLSGQLIDTRRRGDQRLGLGARRPRQHAAPALGLHPHGRRRLRDAVSPTARGSSGWCCGRGGSAPSAAKLDTAVELFGRRWNTPLFLCPVAALEAYHTEGESGAARAAKARGILQIQSHQSSQSYEAIAEARGEPHWFQLYANADWDVNKRTLAKVSAAGCPVLVWTIDLLGGSNRELSRRSQGKEGYDRPLCQSCHNHQEGYQRPMHRGVSGPPGPRLPFTWDYVKRLKDTGEDEGGAEGHRHPRGRRAGGEERRRRRLRVEPRRARREQPARRPSTACPKWSPASRAGCRCSSTAASAAAPTSSRRSRSAPTRSASAGPTCGAWGRSARRAWTG